MTSWSKDDDKYRLPEGVVRIGYDADRQCYQFYDHSDGSLWEGPEGSQYGKLRRISAGPPGESRMFSDKNSPTAERVKSQGTPTSSAPTDFDQILGNMRRERSVSETGLKSSGPVLLGSVIKRSATVVCTPLLAIARLLERV
ncbi:hypothetical protein, variant [Verruconis gallopava]|uniref:Uncharacterized protein n=1 Tax=Verruconis gallopava TaxID=253628 RepID=A0A0D2ADF2_9PEZI|nr:hypothetical protein, variant [Verruconis gallopava]KIW04475.1 hypothetical protein, variant [Verruconis gallopava]